jgi:acyl carrier protein
MLQDHNIQEAIYAAIDDYNSTIPEEDWVKKSPDTVLFHKSGKLDSVGYINLSVAVEARIQSDLGATITLFAHYPDYPGKEPLKTVASLIDFIAWLISKEGGQ